MELENDFGVPQEPILGALLFITYINDLQNLLEKCEMVLYADNTLIFQKLQQVNYVMKICKWT